MERPTSSAADKATLIQTWHKRLSVNKSWKPCLWDLKLTLWNTKTFQGRTKLRWLCDAMYQVLWEMRSFLICRCARFSIAGPLWREFTGHRWIPLTKTSNAELWHFLWSAHEQTVGISNFILHIIMDEITYPCQDWSLIMLVKGGSWMQG